MHNFHDKLEELKQRIDAQQKYLDSLYEAAPATPATSADQASKASPAQASEPEKPKKLSSRALLDNLAQVASGALVRGEKLKHG